MTKGYNVYTRKRNWVCINGRYVQLPAKGKPVVVRNPGKIKAGTYVQNMLVSYGQIRRA